MTLVTITFIVSHIFYVFLLNFMNKNGHALSCDCPKVMTKFQYIGILNASCYVPKMQQVFTASTNGIICL